MAPKAAAPAAKPAIMPTTLEEKKMYVRKHEIKMEDAKDAIDGECNRAAKKTLENALKNLQKDEVYTKCVEDIKEAAAQAARDAERAQVTAKTPGAKVSPKDAAAAKAAADAEAAAANTKADDATLEKIDASFEMKGKDGAAAKATAIAQLTALAPATPFVIPRLEKLIDLFSDSKLGAPAIKAASAIVDGNLPKGHGVATEVVPLLLKGMESKQWKTKTGCIEVLLPCLKQLEATPAQLAVCLSSIVPKLAEAALEVRAEVRNATGAVLRQIGSLVASPEIKKLSQDLVTALAEPTNQKHTQAVLAKMGNQTFLSLIDAASLSLLMPVVIRGLKERDSASKKWSAQIFGSTSMLVKDVDTMAPYLKSVMPLIENCLTDPVSEVVREGAKAYGILEQVLPDYSKEVCQPYLFSKLRHGELGEQNGAALALAEVFLKMDKSRQAGYMPEIEAGVMEEKASVKRGYLELMDTMPQAMKMDFVPFLQRLFPATLTGINGDKDEDTGFRAALAMVQRYGDLCPDLLLPGLERVYCAMLHADTSEERTRQQVVRDKVSLLLGKVVDKVLEHKRFGQDLLTTQDCSNKRTREYMLVLVSLMRADADASVKRYANAAWKNAGGAPKVTKTIMPTLEATLLRYKKGEFGVGAQKLAVGILDELVKSGDLETADESEVEKVERFNLPPPADRVADSEFALIVAGKSAAAADVDKTVADSSAVGLIVVPPAARELLESHSAISGFPACIRKFCGAVVNSVLLEGMRKRTGGQKLIATIVENLKVALSTGDAEAVEKAADELPVVAEAVARAALGEAFDSKAGVDDDDDAVLLYVESLLLMYGAGHLLLKDTSLTMKKNHRYGIVGQNGAGKTTLMKEIANHRIVGMPENLKCVHVDDSKLGEMSASCLTVLEYAIKMAKDIGVDGAGRDTLLSVGFAEKALDEPVSELSTGWRMRLTLAVNMLKNADLVLLDEPTNHLDEESVAWLGDYICSIDQASVMVISHEPRFLNKTCTHIIAYVDKKLEYTEGNFEAFVARKGLTKEQIEAMLSGNLSFDTKKAGEEDEEDDLKTAAPVSGPPKLSFPIPGTMEGVKSSSRAVLEGKNISFRYSKDKDYLVKNASLKLSLGSRVAICGRNGCGKSTLMTLLCSEASVSENDDKTFGEVSRHCNLRMAYMKQDHLKALGPFFDTSPFVYITQRFKDGFDGDLQKRLMEPENEEEAEKRKALAKIHGKYGNQVADLVSRTKLGNQLAYEVRWETLDDPKQNTIVPISTLKEMGLDKVVIACDERIAAKAAGLDQRPLTRREVVRHCEAFGIDEEMCCNRQIRGFSAGQKVRLSLAAMFWTRPHLIAVDEPTNYLDVETVEALAKALTNFRGGIVMIEPKTDFVERICNEKWHMEDGNITIEKLKNNNKRQA